jgi:hypothetical protein
MLGSIAEASKQMVRPLPKDRPKRKRPRASKVDNPALVTEVNPRGYPTKSKRYAKPHRGGKGSR